MAPRNVALPCPVMLEDTHCDRQHCQGGSTHCPLLENLPLVLSAVCPCSPIIPQKTKQRLQLQVSFVPHRRLAASIILFFMDPAQGTGTRISSGKGGGPCRYNVGSGPLILAILLTWSWMQLQIFAWLKSWNHVKPSSFTCFHPQRINWPRFSHS